MNTGAPGKFDRMNAIDPISQALAADDLIKQALAAKKEQAVDMDEVKEIILEKIHDAFIAITRFLDKVFDFLFGLMLIWFFA